MVLSFALLHHLSRKAPLALLAFRSAKVFMPGEKTYTLASGVWPRCPKLTIESCLGTRIARFPLNFLETCGNNTWGYIYYVVSLLVKADPLHPGSLIDHQTGLPVDRDGKPRPGIFQYIEQGQALPGFISLNIRKADRYQQVERVRLSSPPDLPARRPSFRLPA